METDLYIETIFYIIIGVTIVSISFLLWLIPTFCSRKNENATAILWLNIFLGWIPLVWLVLLLAALLGKKKNS